MRVWYWIKEDGERSSQVRPLLKGKIWTLNENEDEDDGDGCSDGLLKTEYIMQMCTV